MLIIPGVEVDECCLADICDRYGIAELKIFRLTSPPNRRARQRH